MILGDFVPVILIVRRASPVGDTIPDNHQSSRAATAGGGPTFDPRDKVPVVRLVDPLAGKVLCLDDIARREPRRRPGPRVSCDAVCGLAPLEVDGDGEDV